MRARRHVARPSLLAVAALVAAGGCGTSSVLDVRYPESSARAAMLAVVPPRRIEIRPVLDRRTDTVRIGVRSENRQDVTTRRPVAEIVRDALVVEMTRNGHSVVADRRDVVLAAEVEEFWIDVVTGYKSSLYVGKVVIALAVVDGDSGRPILARRYVGTKRRQTAAADGGAKDAAREVMQAALARAMHDLATDPTMRAALAEPTRDPPGARAG
jgi:hypothetical protein